MEKPSSLTDEPSNPTASAPEITQQELAIDGHPTLDMGDGLLSTMDGYAAPLRQSEIRIADSPPESESSPQQTLTVVGIGASAGGLEALEQLFSVMPQDTGLAFVVVQHLSPDFKSMMDELLSRRTKIPVVLVEDGMRVEPNHIYLIPAKKDMIISEGRLLLSDKGASQELSLPIDLFFRSLAQDVGARAVGIILSGAGSDGARGIRDIHEAGGLVISQDEGSANFDGMPRSARDTGVVDHVLAPNQMPEILLDHSRFPDSRALAEGGVAGPMRPYGVAAALRFLQRAYGIDFAHYKPSTVTRRIERRLQMTQSASLEAYVERIASDPEELDALFHDLLIGVTRFFRDEAAFELLEKRVIPGLIEQLPPNDEVRVWVAGCATGEEAYSLAILFNEELTRRKDKRRLKVLATDVHRGSLDFASRGLYTKDRVAHVRPDLLERYFDQRGPNYQVSPDLRQFVVFAPHNVVRDAPFTRIDLVSCRNLLIYLQPLAQKKVLNLLHFALKRQGVLFLGPSENAGTLADDFDTVDTHWRIYRKRRDLRLPNDTRIATPRQRGLSGQHDLSTAAGYSLSQVVAVYDALLDEHIPPSLLVNERRELVHSFAGANRFLKIKEGRPSLDVLEMMAPDLKLAVSGALQRALKDGSDVVYNSLRLRFGDDERLHRLTVRPILAPGVPLNHLLVTIEAVDHAPLAPRLESELNLSQLSQDQLGSLEAELRRTKENLQATIEELETSNEELQAANEELLASNEELQSTNEELQSVNEELYTVNAEYQKKITELTELTNDMDNLLASIQVGTIFLDRELCIRKFTPLIAEAFNLLPHDIGRPIAGFSNNLLQPRLMEELSHVLKSAKSVEHELRDRKGNWFFLRILPYRIRGTVDGVVLTLIDIGALKAAEDAVFRERYLLDSLMDSVPDSIYFKDGTSRFVRVNRAMAKRLGIERSDEAVGKTTKQLDTSPEARAFEQWDERALRGEAQPYRKEEYLDKDGGELCFLATRQPLRDGDGGIVGMLGVARDVTEQKRAENEIRSAVKRRDEFLAMLSHELRNPLSAIVNAAALFQAGAPLNPQQDKCLNVIERQSRQMTRLLEDLLEVSRITQNKIELRRQNVDLNAVVQEASVAMREKFDARQVALEVELPEGPLHVYADPARMQQIVVNLLDNGSKYNRPGGNVRVSLRQEAGFAELRVHDDGVGVDPSALANIFEPFVQGRATLHRTDGGMGIGLTVVRSLVDMHGGTIRASSPGTGLGSEFIVQFPISDGKQSAEGERRAVAWPSGKRVVIVEDNIDSCDMLELLLQRGGYDVHTAHDGKRGFELISELKPDLAIVDVGLPGMDGFQVARAVRSRPELTSVFMVALTGYGQARDQEAALGAGFNRHLVKPLDFEELTRLMEN